MQHIITPSYEQYLIQFSTELPFLHNNCIYKEKQEMAAHDPDTQSMDIKLWKHTFFINVEICC